MEKEKGSKAAEDSLFEGRDQVFMDVDRMMNEGLAGGDVHQRYGSASNGEAHEFVEELPPNKWD